MNSHLDQQKQTAGQRLSIHNNAGRILLAALVSIGIVTFNGCGLVATEEPGTGKASTAGETEGGTETELAEVEKSGPCANDVYPIDARTEKLYRLSAKAKRAEQEISFSQTAPVDDSFKETRQFSTGTRVVTNWKCTDDGLRMAEYTNMIYTEDSAFEMETVESSGVTIPKQMDPGDKWQSEYKVRVNLNVGAVTASADGVVTIDHELVSENENISVAGGGFEASRVDSVIRISLKMRGRRIPSRQIRISVWYSPLVGMVKQRVYGDFGEETIEYTGKKDKGA